MSSPMIFDPAARRLRRDRVAGRPPGFLETLLAERSLERLESEVDSQSILMVGANERLADALRQRGAALTVVDPAPRRAARLQGLIMEEDRLDVGHARFDRVLAVGTLDTVNDLPGALILARRALSPSGVFVGCFVGHPSLDALRGAARAADAATGVAVQRVHPQIDAGAGGQLLQRAGFDQCIADAAEVRLSYASLGQLIDDLRASSMTNVLVSRHAVSRPWLAHAEKAFLARAEPDGRVIETLSIITITGAGRSVKLR